MKSSIEKTIEVLRLLAVIIAALLALLGGTSVIEGNPGALDDEPTKTVAETPEVPPASIPDQTAVDGPDQDAKPDDVIQISDDAKEVVAGFTEDPKDLQSEEGDIPLSGTGDLGPIAVLKPPFAADQLVGCRTRSITANWSYRVSGARIQLFWFHYTAGRDVPNSRADVDGLTAYGNNPAARASWHINLDKDGNCDYNVPFRYKAWTQGNANSTGIGMEVHGSGEPPYLRPAGYRKLARIYLQIRRSYGIPLRVGAVSNCVPTRSGIVTHWQGGACSGGHTDIKPHDLQATVSKLRRYVAAVECNKKCRKTKSLRTRHARTHELHRKNRCRTKHEPRHGYCEKLRKRNKSIHADARRLKISLKR